MAPNPNLPPLPDGPAPARADAAWPDASEPVPLAVWSCATTNHGAQQTGRDHDAAATRSATMLCELIGRIVAEYAPPGGLVVDPMCGVGATLVEAVHLGRDAVGVDHEPRRVELTRARLARAVASATRSAAEVVAGDACDLPALLPELVGTADLIATCPPLAAEAHPTSDRARLAGADPGRAEAAAEPEPANRGRTSRLRQQAEMAKVYTACLPMLRPGGLLVVVTEHHRRHGRLLDQAALTVRLATAAGFVYLQHLIALRAAIHGARLIPLPSAGQVAALVAARGRGEAAHLVTHQDILVFAKPAGRPDA